MLTTELFFRHEYSVSLYLYRYRFVIDARLLPGKSPIYRVVSSRHFANDIDKNACLRIYGLTTRLSLENELVRSRAKESGTEREICKCFEEQPIREERAKSKSGRGQC